MWRLTQLNDCNGGKGAAAVSERSCIERLTVCIDELPGEVIVRIGGEAGVDQTRELATALLGLSARRPVLVTLDLGGLRFISSLAMGILVAFRRGVVRATGRVHLMANLHDSVCEALARADLLDLFGWADTGASTMEERQGENRSCPD